ncbi:hypothetical protein [Labedaea rhizosphaerae]|uniref:Uncharacterized protein n=1 Tax=Labedaea rhizosphaerae TaxID=598644 RepID=A0A4R6S076_LABRH|nr:hypothetical protein [Labedaea rhizosphaerae]TDP92881.1 hypothetical protein EV186_107113 [Labedaea rhizosphaerae]
MANEPHRHVQVAVATDGPPATPVDRAVVVSRAWWLEQASAVSLAERGASGVATRAASAGRRTVAETDQAVLASRRWWREQAAVPPAAMAGDGWWRPQAAVAGCLRAPLRSSRPTGSVQELVLASIAGGLDG